MSEFPDNITLLNLVRSVTLSYVIEVIVPRVKHCSTKGTIRHDPSFQAGSRRPATGTVMPPAEGRISYARQPRCRENSLLPHRPGREMGSS